MNENVSCTEYRLTTANNSWIPSDSPLATKLLPEYRSRLKTDIFTFKCCICRKKFNSRKKLMLHQTHSHASQDDEDAQVTNLFNKKVNVTSACTSGDMWMIIFYCLQKGCWKRSNYYGHTLLLD